MAQQLKPIQWPLGHSLPPINPSLPQEQRLQLVKQRVVFWHERLSNDRPNLQTPKR